MSQISVYLLNIVGVVFLIIVVDLILPEGKTSKYIKSIVSIFVIAVILSPVITIIKNGFDFNALFVNGSYQVDNELLESVNRQNIELLEKDLVLFLDKEGYGGVEVMISTVFEQSETKINYIYVNLCDLVISENLAHIDYYTKIKELIGKQINIEAERIVLYG